MLTEPKRSTTDPMQQSFAALMVASGHGAVEDTTVQRAFELTLTSVEDYAKTACRPERRR